MTKQVDLPTPAAATPSTKPVPGNPDNRSSLEKRNVPGNPDNR